MKKQISRREFIKSSAKAGLFMSFAGSGPLKSGTNEIYDLVIKNGTLVDGISNEPYKGDIGIIGEHIKQIGNLQNATGKIVIDATSRVVSPGFIDIHTHTDIEILINPKAESKIRQGVTTELGGNCGSSPFPMKYPISDDEKRLAEEANISIDWTDLKGFHQAIERKGTAVNHATLIGQGTVRGYVMGDGQREPTAEEMDQMKKLVAE
ncbi:MAG: amidohydrolase family protein, partial [Candidatus Aminicenantaceae bacterium]